MSKTKQAMERQQYTPKLIPGTCGNCAHLVFKMELQTWMLSAPAGTYGDEHKVMKQMRCCIGGFAVKKLGSCAEHAFAQTQGDA